MNIKTRLLKVALHGATLVDANFLGNVVKFANMSLGRGFGATTLNHEVKTISDFCHVQKIEISNIFDVGANVGAYSQELRKFFPEAQIFAFEPSKSSANKFSKRFSEDSNVILIESAVGNIDGTATLHSDFESSGLASLTKRRLDHFGISFGNSQDVKVLTLDTWFGINEVIPDFIKIDVEGHELDVLRGAEKIVAKTRLIQFEFGGCNIDTRTFFQDFYYYFKQADFKLFRITPRGLFQIKEYLEEDEYFATTNYLAVNARLVELI